MANKWLEHVKKFKQENPGMLHKEALQKARETYNKQKKKIEPIEEGDDKLDEDWSSNIPKDEKPKSNNKKKILMIEDEKPKPKQPKRDSKKSQSTQTSNINGKTVKITTNKEQHCRTRTEQIKEIR